MTIKQQVLDCLADGFMSTPEIVKRTGLCRQQVRGTIYALRTSGLVRLVAEGSGPAKSKDRIHNVYGLAMMTKQLNTGGTMKPIWEQSNGDVKCWVEARPQERGGRYRILVTTPDKRQPGNGYPYEQEADAIEAARQTFGAIDAIYNKRGQQ